MDLRSGLGGRFAGIGLRLKTHRHPRRASGLHRHPGRAMAARSRPGSGAAVLRFRRNPPGTQLLGQSARCHRRAPVPRRRADRGGNRDRPRHPRHSAGERPELEGGQLSSRHLPVFRLQPATPRGRARIRAGHGSLFSVSAGLEQSWRTMRLGNSLWTDVGAACMPTYWSNASQPWINAAACSARKAAGSTAAEARYNPECLARSGDACPWRALNPILGLAPTKKG